MEKTEISIEQEMKDIELAPPSSGRDARIMRLAERIHESGEWHKHIAPAGSLGLPAKLDENRLKYGIPNAVFEIEAAFDRIFVFQLPRVFGDKIEGSMLFRPASAQKRDEESTPRGVIISAGLKALDNLRSNGMGIGHIVNFIRLSPWRLTVQSIAGADVDVLILRDGDIIGSEELVSMRKAGQVETVLVNTKEGPQHQIRYPNGEVIAPTVPWIADDY